MEEVKKIRSFNGKQMLIWLAALILGGVLGMQLFRHKTKHLKFAVGVPVMMGIHAIIIVFMRAIL